MELAEIEFEGLEDGLIVPAINADVKAEAERILRRLASQAIQPAPAIYLTDDGEIAIHFKTSGVPAAVLIELGNDGGGAWFSSIKGKNKRRRYVDSSDLPDAPVLAQLKMLEAKAAGEA